MLIEVGTPIIRAATFYVIAVFNRLIWHELDFTIAKPHKNQFYLRLNINRLSNGSSLMPVFVGRGGYMELLVNLRTSIS